MHIWVICIWVRPEKQLNDGNHIAKMGADSLAKNTPNTPTIIRQIYTKDWEIVEKRVHRASVIPALKGDCIIQNIK